MIRVTPSIHVEAGASEYTTVAACDSCQLRFVFCGIHVPHAKPMQGPFGGSQVDCRREVHNCLYRLGAGNTASNGWIKVETVSLEIKRRETRYDTARLVE